MPKVIDLPTATSMDDGDYLIMEESSGGTKKITKDNVFGAFAKHVHYVVYNYNGNSAIGSVQEALDNNSVPIDLTGITLLSIYASQGSNRVLAICQNQSLSEDANRRLSAIIFGTYQAPVYTYKRESATWTTVNL